MNIANFIIKGVLGYVIVLFIILISDTNNYFIAGLIPLFPTFGIIGQILVYKDNGLIKLKETVLFGMFSIFPYIAYLLSVFFLIDLTNFYVTIFISTTLWIIVAYLLFISWSFICGFFNCKGSIEEVKEVDIF